MSKLLSFTATGTVGPALGGFRMGNVGIVAGGAATLIEVIGTATFTRMSLGTVAGSISGFNPCDHANGIVFDGPLIISAISGGAVLIEEM